LRYGNLKGVVIARDFERGLDQTVAELLEKCEGYCADGESRPIKVIF
jgi:hypothetical protein